MHRIDHSSKATDLHGSGKHGFTAGSVATQTPATVITADIANALQEEIANAVEGSGRALSKPSNNQLAMTLAGMIDGFAIANHKALTPGSSYADSFRGLAVGTIGGNTMLLAVGQNSEIQSSTDYGVTWTRRMGSGGQPQHEAVAYGGGTFVVVGASGTIRQSSNPAVSWTDRSAAGGYTGYFYGVAHNGSLWVAVGQTAEIQTSPDGVTWTKRTPAGAFADSFNGVCWTGSNWVVGGDVSEVQTSPDGITWTKRTVPTLAAITSIASDGAGNCVAVGGSTGDIYTSSDHGVTWVERTPAESYNSTFYRVACCSSSFTGLKTWVAVGQYGEIQISHDSGATWARRSSPIFKTHLRGVLQGTDTILIVGDSGTIRQSLVIS